MYIGRDRVVMKKAILIVTVLFIAVISTACINNLAVQELNNKARVYMDSGDFEAAINRLEASLDLDNTIFETNYNLGVAYIQAKKYEKACKVLEKAVTINSENPDAWYSIGVAAENYGDELKDMKTKINGNAEDEDNISFRNEDANLSEQQRLDKCIASYTTAIEGFNKYLEKAPNAKDKDEIKQQIQGIELKVAELGK